MDTSASINKSNDNIRLDEFLPALFRYIVLIILYCITVLYFYRTPSQFILSITMLILNFFTVIFLFKDLLSIPNLAKNIYNEEMSLDIGSSEGSIFTKLFVGAIFITLILNFATISIIIYVYDYGNKKANPNTIYKMSGYNVSLMNNFIVWFKWYMMVLGLLVLFVVYSNLTGKMKALLQNLTGLGFSVTIICIASYLCSISVDFLNNKYNLYN